MSGAYIAALPVIPVFVASQTEFDLAGLVSSAGNGPTIAHPMVDSAALADEIAQAAMRIAHSTPEDYLHEIERLDTRTAT